MSDLLPIDFDAIPLSVIAKRVLPFAFLLALWCWETRRPFFGWRDGRYLHALRNLALAVCNTVILGLIFCTLTGLVAGWSEQNETGLMRQLPLPNVLTFAVSLLALDAWMYAWHRANHAIPWLWRFHRVHHSDPHMDVTTATRFHIGEQTLSAILRLALIPALGINVWTLVVYDGLVLAVTMFHHADISLGALDRWVRWFIVTPDMHKVHHSDWQPETDSNYSTVLSLWDRLAQTFRMRPNPKSIVFGLDEFAESKWQTWRGMWATPFHTSAAIEPCPAPSPVVVSRKSA